MANKQGQLTLLLIFKFFQSDILLGTEGINNMDETIFIFYCISMFCTKNFYLFFECWRENQRAKFLLRIIRVVLFQSVFVLCELCMFCYVNSHSENCAQILCISHQGSQLRYFSELTWLLSHLRFLMHYFVKRIQLIQAPIFPPSVVPEIGTIVSNFSCSSQFN